MEGKAKEAFEKWFEKEYRTFTTSYAENVDKINNHIILEWLDSVGIYISISTLGLQSWFKYEIQAFYPLTRMESFAFYRTRQEATEAAIKKAVEIYNNR